jgi:hypothetical protein
MRYHFNFFADVRVQVISENTTEFKRHTEQSEDPSLRELNVPLRLSSHVLLLYAL